MIHLPLYNLFAVILLFAGLLRCGFSTSVSFFGDSHIRVPLDDASANTVIEFYFRTYRPDGLLFLAAGITDYCSIQLHAGAVRVRIDLGSGEASLGSPPGVVFNDLNWHYVRLVRTEADVQLFVDNIYRVTTNTPGQLHELNVDKGVYLGDTKHFDDIFVGNIKSYRGCLQDVIFNSVNILYEAQNQHSTLNVYGVDWDCSPEFRATSNQPISFLSNTSFIAFPQLDARREGRITFDVRTRIERALFAYNSGSLESSDFVAIEIIEGHIKLTVNKGSGAAHVTSKVRVSDGHWHQVELLIGIANIRVSVDGRKREKRTGFAKNQFLDLYALLYVGGLGPLARAQAVSKGLKSLSEDHGIAGSMMGCLQNFKINGKLMGFREAELSHALHPECMWSYPCANNPCIEDSLCVEEGFYYYRCLCDQVNCFKRGATGKSASTLSSDVIHAQDLIVRESGRSLITRNNIDLLVDYEPYNIDSTAILFKVVNMPEHGNIRVDMTDETVSVTTFTWFDVTEGRVTYTHDGSESLTDSVGLELDFLGVTSSLQSLFSKTYGFILMIQIAPWNDKPEINLLREDTLRMVANTQVKITPAVMNVTDKDDDPEDLEYTLQYEQGFDTGYFEISDAIGIRARVMSFTQQDINDGNVKFIHRGTMMQQIRLQVSDGKDVSDPKVLNIFGEPLKFSFISNTGLLIPSAGTAFISTDNLTAITNVMSQDLVIRYEVTVPPFFGEIQRQVYPDDSWMTASVFTQNHIDMHRLRYIHNGGPRPHDDHFRFKVGAMGKQSIEHTFEIRLLKTEVKLTHNKPLQLDGVRERHIASANLKAVSSIPSHKSRDILFIVIAPPRHGNILKISNQSSNKLHKERVTVGANFSQSDIRDGKILYRLHKTLFTPIHDQFQFRLAIPGNASDPYVLQIKYKPVDTEFHFINNGLVDVLEGGSKVITAEDLYIETDNIKNCRFTITEGPYHGFIQLIHPMTKQMVELNASTFTNVDIKDGRVHYKHDDSETQTDEFDFIATPILQQSETVQEITQSSGKFDIKILLKNDETPQKVVDKVFQVVANTGRLITIDDLMYVDPDIDYNNSLLLYTRREISNGQIVRTRNHSHSVYTFTQAELEDGSLYFRHRGGAHGKSVIWVTDGQYYTNGIFEVEASAPYIKIVNNTGVSVQRGLNVQLLSSNLSIESNMDALQRDVKFIIRVPPRHGKIEKHGQNKNRFNLADLKNGHVFYVHDNSTNTRDSFKFVARIDSTQTEGEVAIKIVSEGAQHPPHIVNNKVQAVEEGEVYTLSDHDLLVAHPETDPASIKYTITSQPKYGILLLQDSPPGEAVLTFTQADINSRSLQYLNQKRDGDTDIFTFDVTNGISALQGLEFVIEIVPHVIPMELAKFKVLEGHHKSLSTNIIRILSKHYKREDLSYLLVKNPKSGYIVDIDKPDDPIHQFSQLQLENEQIAYVHNGNDTLKDSFTIIARSRLSNKQSNPTTVQIIVKPVNDQSPKVVSNKQLIVWQGFAATIDREHLEAVDQDSEPEQLIYSVSDSKCGQPVLADQLDSRVSNFTQAQVNAGQVIFIHKGDTKCSLHFQVSDGEHVDRRRQFQVVSRRLVLTVINDKPLEVYPGMSQPITTEHFKVITNDVEQSHPILYSIQRQPSHGQLVTNVTGTAVEISKFSQQEIDDGFISYVHSSALVGLEQEDKIIYDVYVKSPRYSDSIASPYVTGIDFKSFSIRISYENVNEGNRDKLLHSSPISVEEGGQVSITRDKLDIAPLRRKLAESGIRDPHIRYVIKRLPLHGVLSVGDVNVTVDDTFIQRDINKKRVIYFHDGSDTLWDVFRFVIEIDITNRGVSSKQLSNRLTNVCNITISPVNDKKFMLKTESPSIELVQSFPVNITSRQLLTIDEDTPPSGIIYKITDGPSNGYVALRENYDRAVLKFTQRDVNDKRVVFIPDGGIKSGAFFFGVSDGHFKPSYKVFSITVHPLTLELNGTNDLLITQGVVSATLPPNTFLVDTNGDRSKIMYNVTKFPDHGDLYMLDSPVYEFSQNDVELGRVTYIQKNLSAVIDQLEFILYDHQNSIGSKKLNIRVVSNLKKMTGPMTVAPGENFTLTLNMLDASELARVTSDDPVYVVTNLPKLGNLVKYPPPNREGHVWKREARKNKNKDEGRRKNLGDVTVIEIDDIAKLDREPKFKFSHSDVMNEKVLYVPNASNMSGPQLDSFAYKLTARNSQPFEDRFQIMIASDLGEMASGTGPGGIREDQSASQTKEGSSPTGTVAVKPGKTDEKTDPDARRYVSRDHLLILFIVAGITAAIIVLFIIIKCLKRSRNRKKKFQVEADRMMEETKTPLDQLGLPVNQNGEINHDDTDLADSQLDLPVIKVTAAQSINTLPSTSSIPSRPLSQNSETEVLKRSVPSPTSSGSPTTPTKLSKTEISSTVPTCKVTPIMDDEDGHFTDDSLKQDQSTFDWENIDPELLQHCRTTTPVLHKNKYWV